MIETGEKAPDFTLKNENGETFVLSAFLKKWVVLYFYPRDNTPGCTAEALEFSAAAEDFEQLNTVVAGISPDSCESHRRFFVKHNLNVRLLSDPNKHVLGLYGAWGKKKMYGKVFPGVIRSTVLINPSGEVAWVWPRVKARGHADKVLEKVREFN